MKNILTIFMIGFFMICYSKPVIGYFDVAHPEQGCQGWALDTDNPYASIYIHFYANAPAGLPGSVFIGSTFANRSRPDINAAGYGGNHGFLWQMPVTLTTPCQIAIYAYGIDLNGNGNPNLNNSPKLMPILTKSIANTIDGYPITLTASSQYAGAIYSLIWKGKQFIDSGDHGRLLQSASSFYDYSNSWSAECYNPTEAGSDNNGNSTCTDSRLLDLNILNGQLYTKTQMAFYGRPGSSSPGCSSVINTAVTSEHTMEKFVQIGLPNIPNAIKYTIKFKIPQNETHLSVGQFEALTGYLKGEFNTFFHYNQNDYTLTQTNQLGNIATKKPVIMCTSDGQYAIGIYSPEVKPSEALDKGYYEQYYFSSQNASKWNFVKRINNIQTNTIYTFNSFICIGSLEKVRTTLSQLITAYPNN
jgi:hypothetical protein